MNAYRFGMPNNISIITKVSTGLLNWQVWPKIGQKGRDIQLTQIYCKETKMEECHCLSQLQILGQTCQFESYLTCVASLTENKKTPHTTTK